MKFYRTIPLLLLLLSAPPARGAVPKMQSPSFLVTSSEFSAMGDYKESEHFNTWDTLGQPTAIGAWTAGNHSGAGWAYTINLPVWWDKDRDRDGMPVAWEEQFAYWEGHTMSDFNPDDAIEDWDGAGFVNIQEFLARTSPIDNTSFFQFTDIRIVSSGGEPTLVWRNPTIRIDGFETEYPDYTRSLSYDVLYADWPRHSQAVRNFPSDNWFNLTGTWQVHESGTGLHRHGEFNYFTDTTIQQDLDDGDIRFYRLAIGGTYLEGEPVPFDQLSASWAYYTEVGTHRMASTLAKEVMMVQRHDISRGTRRKFIGLPGEVPGSGGILDLSLGTTFFPSGLSATEATRVEFWKSRDKKFSISYLDESYPEWRGETGFPTTDKIRGDEAFLLIGPEPSFDESLTFYAGGRLKMDSYYHEIHKRDWNGQTIIRPGEPNWMSHARTTVINYNFPVEKRFLVDLNFPDLAGTTNPSSVFGAHYESDWVQFFERDLSGHASGLGPSYAENVVIYQDHSDGSQWKYFLPLRLSGEAVGTELTVSPGSPVVVRQYWNPDEPLPWDEPRILTFPPPYQNQGNREIRTYLRWVDN